MATAESTAYDRLLAQASRLPPADQLRLVEDLAALVRQRMTPAPAQSVTALRGLGKEVWQGVDAQEYVDSAPRGMGRGCGASSFLTNDARLAAVSGLNAVVLDRVLASMTPPRPPDPRPEA